jgi:hypothetical protein
VPLDDIQEAHGIFDEPSFERALEDDIRSAKESVVIFSAFVTSSRVGKLSELLCAKLAEDVRIRCVTRPPHTNGSIPVDSGREALDMLEAIGVVVDCRARIHQKFCLIDNRIVWMGSLNALSHAGQSDETMTRTVSAEFAAAIAASLSKRGMPADWAALSIAEAENPRCGSCGSRSVYADDESGPHFYCENQCGWSEPVKEGPPCPRCGSETRLRDGRYGPFYGCSKYPKCKGTINLSKHFLSKRVRPATKRMIRPLTLLSGLVSATSPRRRQRRWPRAG